MSETRSAVDDGASALTAAGMSAREAAAKARLFDRARHALAALAGDRAERARTWFVPGRLEVVGKHTDYAGGRSLVCAIERGFCVVAVPRGDSQLRIVDAADGSTVTVRLKPDTTYDPHPNAWGIYPQTVVRRLARNFPDAHRGADIAFESDLPAAAGMSSSSGLLIAIFLVLADLNGIESREDYRSHIRTLEDLAGYVATIENGQSFGSLAGDRGVGTFGGSEDHLAILCSRPDFLTQYAFAPTRRERVVALPANHVFALAASGIAAQKTGTARDAYNDAAANVQQIVDLWRNATGRIGDSLGTALASGPGAADRIRQLITTSMTASHATSASAAAALRRGKQLLDRFEQFVEESDAIVPAVVDAMSCGDLVRLGSLVDRSQELAERLLGNQVPETIALARSARALGARASSAFGAGFGGSVWALVAEAEGDAFTKRWAETYRRDFPAAAPRAVFFTTRPGPAATAPYGRTVRLQAD